MHAPILYKFSSVAGCPEDDLYKDSNVLDVDIIHHLSIEEEEKLDKKAVIQDVKNYAKIKFKDLISKIETLNKKQQWVLDYSKQIGLNLSGE